MIGKVKFPWVWERWEETASRRDRNPGRSLKVVSGKEGQIWYRIMSKLTEEPLPPKKRLRDYKGWRVPGADSHK